MSEQEAHWSLDRRVPIGIIVALLVQSAGLVWWARGVVADIELVRADKSELDRRVTTIERRAESDKLSERMAVIENQIRQQTELLVRIDQRLNEKSAR